MHATATPIYVLCYNIVFLLPQQYDRRDESLSKNTKKNIETILIQIHIMKISMVIIIIIMMRIEYEY